MHMKMARASERDIQAALDVSNILDGLDRGYMPSETEEPEPFYPDDREQCQRALDALLRAAQTGGVFRVIFGMAVVLDPRNELLDPDADTLELHPKLRAALNPWQPMDSAPKGGEIILLAAINDHHVMVREARWDAGRKDWAGWAHIADIQPNYWMPLPAPPTDTGAQS